MSRPAPERANSLVDALLVLARSEAQAGRRLSRKMPADLSTGVASAISAMRTEADRISLAITTDPGPAPVVGDPGLLDRLAGNLIENAVRYNHRHGTIDVRTGGDDQHSWLVVRNSGFEVDPLDMPACSSRSAGADTSAPVAAARGWGSRSCGPSPRSTVAPCRPWPTRRAADWRSP
jgi:hypothetical protein